MHPERDWSIGVFLALLIFIASATWSLTVYLVNRNISPDTGTGQQDESVVYRESMVEEALTRLEERATTLASLLPRTVQSEPVIEEPVEEPVQNTEEETSIVEEGNEPEVAEETVIEEGPVEGGGNPVPSFE
jgi:hypothetical protein